MIDRPLANGREQARWIVLGLAGVVLLGHSLLYNFVTDDAYISFVYSRNFAEHGELAFNLGDPVEGYTNFSWTVLLGIAMKLGIVPELSSRVLGTLCALATLYIVMRTMERALGRRTAWSAVPSLLLACSSGFACWTSGGLETQLFTLLVAATLDAVVAAVGDPRALRRGAICLALAAMTRPEGPLVAAVLGAVWLGHVWLVRRTRVPVAVALAIDKLPAGRLARVIAIAAAGLFVCALIGGGGLLASYGVVSSALGKPALIAIAGLIGIPLFGLLDCVRAAGGHPRAQLQIGASLLAIAGLIAVGAIRYGAPLDAAVTWSRAMPVALLSIAVGSAALGIAFARS